MRDLLAELTTALDHGRPCVWCAVVETRGSTPQKAGAAMLVFADGTQRGTLGGGCVEAEVKQGALRVLGDPVAASFQLADASDETPGKLETCRHARLLTFCLDDNYGWDDGLICGGRMTILVDPVAASASAAYYRRFRDLIESGHGCTEAVLLNDQAFAPSGVRYLFDAAGQLAASSACETVAAAVPEAVCAHLPPLAARPRPVVHHGVAYLPVLPRITLLIVGGGHVGQAVARLAADCDFDVWVLDDRQTFVSRERFPTAHRLLVGDIGGTLKELARSEITPSVYALIVTRGHAHDEEALYHLAPTAAGYVGMIGSKRKIKLIFEDLVARGIGSETLAKVHAPLGLPIGSQTVPEIAVSIVAELIAHRNLSEPAAQARAALARAACSQAIP